MQQGSSKDKWIAIVRTVSPMVWSFVLLQATPVLVWLASLLSAAGLEFSKAQIDVLNQAAVAVIAAVIYAFVTWASVKFPLLQWILLVPVQPAYPSLKEGKP